ncbi:uncharacterized protein TNCV_4023851 [Trichonephila clavipes]|nr:uncharacterized protein TNCV_4023851 [Trichonephila clavipes]
MAIYVSADHYDQRQPREQSNEKIITPKMMHTLNTCRQISGKQFHSEQPCTVNIEETAKSPYPPIPTFVLTAVFASNQKTSISCFIQLNQCSLFRRYLMPVGTLALGLFLPKERSTIGALCPLQKGSGGLVVKITDLWPAFEPSTTEDPAV